MEDELKALLQRVGLGLEQVLTRTRFLQWQTGDALRLNRAAAELDAAQAAPAGILPAPVERSLRARLRA